MIHKTGTVSFISSRVSTTHQEYLRPKAERDCRVALRGISRGLVTPLANVVASPSPPRRYWENGGQGELEPLIAASVLNRAPGEALRDP